MIVDDEPLAQQVLKKYIDMAPELELVAVCFNAPDAFEVLCRQPVDLLFLDIKMPHIAGTQFIQSLKNPPAFIFTTAHPDYAVMSYELQAVDYLLKPITWERFQKSISRFLKQSATLPQQPEKNYLYIKVNGNLVKLYHEEILFAQSMKDYIKMVTPTATYLTHLTMKSLISLLPETVFKRVHRSYLVNVQHISVIGKDAVVIRNNSIPLGEQYKGNLKT
jgi:two-component system LytT family response regulator